MSSQPSIYWFGLQASDVLPEPEQDLPQPAPANLLSVMINFNDSAITLRNNREEMSDSVASTYAMGGSAKLWELGNAIKAARVLPKQPKAVGLLPERPSERWWLDPQEMLLDPAETILDLYEEACTELWRQQGKILKEVEDSSALIIRRRLQVSRAQIQEEATRYLTGFDAGTVFADPTRELRFGPNTSLASNSDAERLRRYLKEIYAAKQKIASIELKFRQLSGYDALYYADELLKLRKEIAEQIESYARLVYDRGRQSPILHWIAGVDPEDSRDSIELPFMIKRELRIAWNSALEIEQCIKARPAAGLEHGAANPPIQLGSLIKDADKQGPWRYPRIIAEAMEELGWSPPSIEASAVEETLGEAGSGLLESLGVSFGLMSVLAALHIAVPPLGFAADIAIGAYYAVKELIEYERDRVDFRATLNPADALALPPNFLPVLAAIVGAIPITSGAGQAFQFGIGVLPAILPQEEQ